MSPVLSLRPIQEEEWTRYRFPEEQAYFGSLSTTHGHLPLRQMQLRGRITGLAYRLALTQRFFNSYSGSLEATYIFPLPARAAVTRFIMRTRDQEIHGELRERGQAREIYAQAKAQGFQAALAEEERPEVFTMSVGNIPPGESIEIELELSGPLAIADNMATFRFPLVVAPRYIPGRSLGDNVGEGTAWDTDATPDASRISPPVLLSGYPNPVRLGIEIEIDGAGLDFDTIHSSLDALQLSRHGEVNVLRLAPSTGQLNRDLILRFPILSGKVRSSVSAFENREEGTTTWALTLLPSGALEAPMPPRYLVVLLDRSGSMGGWKMAAARRAVGRIIDCFNDCDSFSVLAFDDSIEEIASAPRWGHHSGLTPASDYNRFRAIQALAKVEARGGTELGAAIMEGLNRLGNTHSQDCFLIVVTDGQVGNEDQILREAQRKAGPTRIFTVGIDEAVNASMLQRLASSSGGHCHLVESESLLDHVMRNIQQRLGQPLLTDIQVSLPGAIDLTPEHVDLYPGLPARLYGRCPGSIPSRVTVRGRDRQGNLWSQDMAAFPTADPVVESLWARERLLELEHGFVTKKPDPQYSAASITRFSLAHNVLCRFTSFVAVDRTRRIQNGGPTQSVVQAVDAPSGWANRSAAPGSPVFSTMMDPLGSSGGGESDPFSTASDPFSSAPFGCPPTPEPFCPYGPPIGEDPFAKANPFVPADPFAYLDKLELQGSGSPAPFAEAQAESQLPSRPSVKHSKMLRRSEPAAEAESSRSAGFAPPPPPELRSSGKAADSVPELIALLLKIAHKDFAIFLQEALPILEKLLDRLSGTSLEADLVKKGYKILDNLRVKHPGASARMLTWLKEVNESPKASREGWWKT